MTSLYIHIPFCVKKCNYCDFLSFPDMRLKDDYKRALINEINAFDCSSVKSIFIGGGTPSVLEGGDIADIMQSAGKFNISENAEITIEANPDTITAGKLKIYRQNGINRISIGLQAWQNGLLEKLGRVHRRERFLRAYDTAYKYFDNINIDLMFSLPSQTYEMWLETLENVTALEPKHISAYSLIVEEGTPFYGMELELPDEETDRRMYHSAVDFLASKGYEQYEISNFAKKGFHSVHNCVYWERGEYKGFGLGAASLINNVRYKNTESMVEYISGVTVAEKEELSDEDIRAEYMFLGLRMNKGVSISRFNELFGRDMLSDYADVIKKYRKYFVISGDRLSLTTEGFDISNIIMAEML